MITVTFTAATLFQGSMRSIGSTLSVTETDARVLVDIGVATASGVTPQGGWPTGELSDTFLAKADNLTGLASNSTARTNLGLGGLATINDAPSDGSDYVRKNAAWSVATGGGGGGVDIQTFGGPESSGTFTDGWVKPAGAKWVEVHMWGAGGGGGSGAVYPTTSGRTGGGGGAAGAYLFWKIPADSLGSTETVVVATGGAGGAARTSNGGNGNAGVSPGSTLASRTKFWKYATGNGNGGGGGTINSSGTAQAGFSTPYVTFNVSAGGGASTTTGAASGTPSSYIWQATGGGAGAGQAANVTTSRSGAAGGVLYAISGGYSGLHTQVSGGGGGTISAAPTNGVTAVDITFSGTGGGGGRYITATVGQNGANGGWPAGGGGGGGAVDNDFFPSGAGGAGANGFVVVVTYS